MQEILLFIQQHWLLSTILIVILALLTILEFVKLKSNTQLTPTQATQMINHENATIVDVRQEEAYAAGHIIGAISLPLNQIESKTKKIEKFKTKPIILVCASGAESAKASALLAKKGFTSIYILRNGLRGWQTADMPLVKG